MGKYVLCCGVTRKQYTEFETILYWLRKNYGEVTRSKALALLIDIVYRVIMTDDTIVKKALEQKEPL